MPSLLLNLPRRWTVALVAAALVAVGVTVVVVDQTGDDPRPCGAERLGTARSPLLDDAGMADQPDERLDRLGDAITGLGPPFGEVLAGVGFDYDQYLRLYGVDDGVLAWTKNSAEVTLLDPTSLAARWSLRPATKRTAWDASDDDFLLLGLDRAAPTTVSLYGLGDGERRWCTDLAQAHDEGAPVSTTFLDGGDLLTALEADDGSGITVTSLAAQDGDRQWQRTFAGAARADHLSQLDSDTALVGGIEEFSLPDARRSGGSDPVLTAFATEDGETDWTWSPGSDSVAHVVGVADGRVVVMVTTTAGYDLVALNDEDGTELWRAQTSGFAHEATLRDGVVVTRSPAGLAGYDSADGSLRWRLPTPTDRTFFPYGFTLGQMPSLDAEHVLLPTTTALQVLDLRDASSVSYPLPVDGVSTTYWPYQLLVTEDVLGVVTNTGGIVARREAPESPSG